MVRVPAVEIARIIFMLRLYSLHTRCIERLGPGRQIFTFCLSVLANTGDYSFNFFNKMIEINKIYNEDCLVGMLGICSLLALVSKEGNLVLDPFSGSASTAIAAWNTDRNFIGFEIDTEYYQAGVARLEKIMKTPRQLTINNYGNIRHTQR
jgi:uncharacterized protein YuzB (UPF0349 family)